MKHRWIAVFAALALLACFTLWVKAQTPAPTPLPAARDAVRVMIEPGHSVTIYAPADRVSTRPNRMGETVVEIDIAPRPATPGK